MVGVGVDAGAVGKACRCYRAGALGWLDPRFAATRAGLVRSRGTPGLRAGAGRARQSSALSLERRGRRAVRCRRRRRRGSWSTAPGATAARAGIHRRRRRRSAGIRCRGARAGAWSCSTAQLVGALPSAGSAAVRRSCRIRGVRGRHQRGSAIRRRLRPRRISPGVDRELAGRAAMPLPSLATRPGAS